MMQNSGVYVLNVYSLRFDPQVEGVSRIDANDIDPKSVQAIRRNVECNGPEAAQRVHATQVKGFPHSKSTLLATFSGVKSWKSAQH